MILCIFTILPEGQIFLDIATYETDPPHLVIISFILTYLVDK
jgi:hypothetical protein